MSIKLATFRAKNIQPLTQNFYRVRIDNIADSEFIVNKTNIPFPERGVDEILIQGQTLRVPNIQKFDGTWTCTIAEDVILSRFPYLFTLFTTTPNEPSFENQYIAKSIGRTESHFFSVEIDLCSPLTMNAIMEVLGGAFLNQTIIRGGNWMHKVVGAIEGASGLIKGGLNKAGLQATNIMEGMNPLVTATLKGCFIKKISPVSLAWNSPDQTVEYEVTFGYTYVSYKLHPSIMEFVKKRVDTIKSKAKETYDKFKR